MKDDKIWLGCRDGTVLVLDLASGAEIRRIAVPQALSLGLREIKDQLVAVAIDGTIPIESTKQIPSPALQ